MALTVLDIAIAADASGKLRASWLNFSESWSDESVREYAAKHNAQGPRRYHVVEVTAERMAEIRAGKNYGYATSSKDPATAVPVDSWVMPY